MKITPAEFFKKNKYYPAEDLIKKDKILCYQCRKRESNCFLAWGLYNIGKCDLCLKKSITITQMKWPEFTTEAIKEGRKSHFNSQVQPYREGIPSKEFYEAYPDKAKKLFKQDVRKMEYTYRDVPGWSHRERSK